MTSLEQRPPRIDGLDALRGVAVFLVMVRHMAPTVIGGAGIVGVTMFFALSGYLITGVLDRDLQKVETIRWSRFYAHRGFRLLPALLALLFVWAVVEDLTGISGARTNAVPSLLLGLTYLSDLPLPWSMSPGLNHLWTLAIEEQFYLVWPALLWFAFRRRWPLFRVAMVSAVLLTAGCWVALLFADRPGDLYTRPWTWASALALGAATYAVRARLGPWVKNRASAVVIVSASVLIVISAIPGLKDSPLCYLLCPTAIAAAMGLMTLVASTWTTMPRRWMQPAVWLGTVSYGAYLWNLPVNEWYRIALADLPRYSQVLTIPITIALALASWYTVEALGRWARRRFDLWQARRAAEGRFVSTLQQRSAD